jgi:hypothetical protein
MRVWVAWLFGISIKTSLCSTCGQMVRAVMLADTPAAPHAAPDPMTPQRPEPPAGGQTCAECSAVVSRSVQLPSGRWRCVPCHDREQTTEPDEAT